MTKPKKGTPPVDQPMPQEGGSYIRQPDGSLVREVEPEAEPAPETGAATDPEPPVTPPAGDDTQSLEG